MVVMVITLASCVFTVMPVTVEAIGMAAQSIGMGTAIGTVAIGVGMAIGIGGTVDGGPMVLALVGEWFLAAGFGSATDSAMVPAPHRNLPHESVGMWDGRLHPKEAITNDLVDMRAGE